MVHSVSNGKLGIKPRTCGATENSAEWITEAPAGLIGVLPLADIGTVTFSHGTATISGITGGIGSFATVYSITMLDFPAGAPAKQTVSALTGGNSFHTKWAAMGPYG